MGIELKTLADFPAGPEVVEDGDSFAAECRPQGHRTGETPGSLGAWAKIVASVSMLWAANQASTRPALLTWATDDENNRLLLERLAETPLERRMAYYACHAVVADPQGNLRAQSEARRHGRIRFEPAGSMGFGYDPLFEIVEYHRTFAELGETVKRGSVTELEPSSCSTRNWPACWPKMLGR